jgi:hypothetical protein
MLKRYSVQHAKQAMKKNDVDGGTLPPGRLPLTSSFLLG